MRRTQVGSPAALTAVAVLFIAPAAAMTQEAPRAWSLEGELGASVFFGASDQTAFIFRSAYEHDDGPWDVAIDGSFAYGEADDQEGVSSVNKRSWATELSLDYTVDRFVPFVFGGAEGSFERQIAMRLSGGAGTRLTFVRNDRSRLDLSVGLLGEYTRPRDREGQEKPETKTLIRWSNRLRASRNFLEDRGEFSLIAFYKPAFRGMDDYTIEVNSSVSFAVNASLTLKVSLVDRYDNLATSRGAASNNDGRLYLSFLAAY